MHKLSDFNDGGAVRRDGGFMQTQFATTDQKNSLCFARNRKFIDAANRNAAISCVITEPELAPLVSDSKGLWVSETPEEDFYRLHNELAIHHQMRPALDAGIDPSASIHPDAHVDDYTEIGPGVTVAAGAIVLAVTILREGVEVGPGAIVGADGHFYKRFGGHLFCVRHAGGVLAGKNAHILAGAIVSRSLHTDFTVIGSESVVSVKSHVAHGCHIGDRVIIAGASQVSGYTRIGDDAWIGPGCTIGNLLTIGSGVSVEAGSVVIENLENDARVSGNFAIPHGINMMRYVRARGRRKK